MNCRCDDTLLQMYVDGSMGTVERDILEVHLKLCPRCRQLVSQYKGLLWDLEHPVEVPVPPQLGALSDRLMDAWADATAPERWQEASRAWTQQVPVVSMALASAGRFGRRLPRWGLAGVTGLAKWLWKGGVGR